MSEERREIKELEEIPAIPRPDLYEMIRDAYNPRDKRLMASFVMMANRCSEGLSVSRGEVHKEVSVNILDLELRKTSDRMGRLRTEVDVGKSLGKNISDARGELERIFDDYQVMSDLKKRFYIPSESVAVVDEIAERYPQTLVYVVKLITLKRKKRIPRLIPVPVIDPLAPLFVQALEKDLKDSFFGISRQRVWQLFKRAGIFAFYQDQGYPVPKNPLRHLRLTEASNFLNEQQLYRYAGWKIKGTPDKYVHTRWDDFVEPLVRVAQRAPPL